MADFVDGAAEVASQESDVDSEAGETRQRDNGGAGMADSSEEEESEDEEAARAVRVTLVFLSDSNAPIHRFAKALSSTTTTMTRTMMRTRKSAAWLAEREDANNVNEKRRSMRMILRLSE